MRSETGVPRSAAGRFSRVDAAPPLAPDPERRAGLIRVMTEMLAHERPESAATALKVLRRSFPDYPLALRLLAIASTMKRRDGEQQIALTDECPSLADAQYDTGHSPR